MKSKSEKKSISYFLKDLPQKNPLNYKKMYEIISKYENDIEDDTDKQTIPTNIKNSVLTAIEKKPLQYFTN